MGMRVKVQQRVALSGLVPLEMACLRAENSTCPGAGPGLGSLEGLLLRGLQSVSTCASRLSLPALGMLYPHPLSALSALGAKYVSMAAN